MFTGIIEEIGKVAEFSKSSNGAKLKINCAIVLGDVKIGDSISINGCCQTVVNIGSNWFEVDVSYETLKVTNFSKLKTGEEVNLERALTLQSRLGGHIVQGHVDCIGKYIDVKKLSNFYNLYFEIPKDMTKYIVKKGSIAINGISLTIADITENSFYAAVIPHTFENTNLKNLKFNDIVNIETDILGKYVEKFLLPDNNVSKISEDFLAENGFI